VTRKRLRADLGIGDTTFDRHEQAGRLRRHGRVGGNGAIIYRREDVLAWLAGETAPSEATARPMPPRRARTTATNDNAAALDRIAAVAKGGAR
jgi:hypothetical protein